MARVPLPLKLAPNTLKGAIVMVASAGVLTGCISSSRIEGRATQPPPARVLAPEVATPSAASKALRAYYAGVQAELLSQGLMRTDTGAKDAPFSARMLANNFARIAFYDEFDSSSGRLIARVTEKRLRRWQKPVRVGLNFGTSVPQKQRAIEEARVRSFLARWRG